MIKTEAPREEVSLLEKHAPRLKAYDSINTPRKEAERQIIYQTRKDSADLTHYVRADN